MRSKTQMSTGSQVKLEADDDYVEDVYVTTRDLNFDVDAMSRKDVMTLGMGPINKFREDNWPILLNGIQFVATLVTVGSMLMMSLSINDLVTVYFYVNSSQTLTWGCMELGSGSPLVDALKPSSAPRRALAWIWISSGFWGGILPLFTGFLMNCSSNLSPKGATNDGTYFGAIFYNANFPVRNPPGLNLLRILSLVDLVVVFILNVINAIMSERCNSPDRVQSKFIFPVAVACLSSVILLLVLFSPAARNRNLSREENLHVGHTHILIRKFPSAGPHAARYQVPTLVGHGPPVVYA